MKRLLLLAATTGYQVRAFGDAAAALGVDLVFATDRCHVLDDPWRDGAIPVHFHDEDAALEAIVDAARTSRLDGVLAVGDRPTLLAAMTAEALGLPWHGVDGARAAGNKGATRERLRASGLLTPRFHQAALDADPGGLAASIGFPAVLKPLSLSASRGVMRVNDLQELGASLERLRALLQSPDIQAERSEAHRFVLLEEFIQGQEVAVEALMDRGTFHPLAIFAKPDPLDGPFFEETIYVTPSGLDRRTESAVVDAVRNAASALGLWHGPVHAECRLNPRGVCVLEVAARPIGGLCARVLRLVPPGAAPDASVTLEELLLRHAVGEPAAGWRREASAASVMMVPIPRRGILRGVSGLDAALAVPCIEHIQITAKLDQRLVPLPEGASYLGFIFARAGAPAEAEAAVREAHRRLRFEIQPEVRVLQSAHG